MLITSLFVDGKERSSSIAQDKMIFSGLINKTPNFCVVPSKNAQIVHNYRILLLNLQYVRRRGS